MTMKNIIYYNYIEVIVQAKDFDTFDLVFIDVKRISDWPRTIESKY